MTGFEYEMDTKLTFNADFSNSTKQYEMVHNKTGDWRLNGSFKFDDMTIADNYFCLVHADRNIMSLTNGLRR